MSSNPTPNFHDLDKYQSLSTKKERKSCFSNFANPPKAPARSCPVPRFYSVFKEVKEDAPRPVSFQEDCTSSFISESALYEVNKGTYFEQCFRVEKVLGTGDFGKVFKVVNKETGLSYACKRTLLKYKGEQDRQRRIEEVKKHELLPPHINCIRFYRAWEEANHLYLLTEECQNTLADILLNIHEFPESQLWSFMVDILQGVHHLHEHKLIHMDVKPENIFIGLDGHCKLGDFGLVIDISKGYPKEAIEGDAKYLAPECLQNVYTPAADIFSLGMVMLELATDLFLPKAGPHWHELRRGNLPTMRDKGLSPEFESAIRGFLEPDPKKRLTPGEVLAYKSVKQVIRKKEMAHFLRTKVLALKWCLQTLLLWPMFVIMFVSSVISNKFLEDSKRADISSPQLKLCKRSQPKKDPVIESPIQGCGKRRSFAMRDPIVNSTPINFGKRRIFPTCNFSRSNCEAESIDGSKISFNESSFSSLEASCDLIDHHSPVKEEQICSMNLNPRTDQASSVIGSPKRNETYSMNITSRNLIDLFNSADSSEDEM